MNRLSLTAFLWLLFALATPIAVHAQYTQIYDFVGGDGHATSASLVQGFDGYLYGVTDRVAFKVRPVRFSSDTILYFFCSQSNCPDGANPTGLLQASDGNFYGTTNVGGNTGCIFGNGCGTVFKLTPDGTLSTLYRFSGPDGANPDSGVVQADDGSFYGTTYAGGTHNRGTIFRITTTGTLTVLYNFCGRSLCADGASPVGTLVQGSDGSFYGTTTLRGSGNVGTVFSMNSSGKLRILHSFSGTDGESPYSALTQASDGKFYGTTYVGGDYGLGSLFSVTSSGSFTTLHSFCAERLPGCSDGANPYGGLVQSVWGDFYGTTYDGGKTFNGLNAAGTSFTYFGGSLGSYYGFLGAGDGANPLAGLIEGTDGSVYGTTQQGGVGQGTIFSLATTDSPFVIANPSSGKEMATVTIMGNNLTGATKVSFSNKTANFTVISDTQISATVPVGASTGKIRVTTPNGQLLSKAPFRVLF